VTSRSSTNLIIMSDHGVVRSLWESELSNHGQPRDGNESFLFIYDKSFQKSRKPLEWEHVPRETPGLSTHGEANSLLENQPQILEKFKEINSYEVVATLTQLFRNANVPINSIGMPKELSNRNSSQLKRLRMVEMQVYQYFMGLTQEEEDNARGSGQQDSGDDSKKAKPKKEEPKHEVAKKIVFDSPFNRIIKKIDSEDLRESNVKEWAVKVDSAKLSEEIELYKEFVSNLIEDIKYQLKSKSNLEKIEKNLLIVFLFFVFCIGNGVLLLLELSKSRWIIKWVVGANLSCLLLPILCFILLGHIDEHGLLLLVPFSLMLSTLFLFVCKKCAPSTTAKDLSLMIDSNLGFLLLNFSIFAYDWMVSFDNFAFFYFRNPIFQILSLILMCGYLALTLKVINLSPNTNLNYILGFCILLMCLFMVVYEFILMFSTSFLQSLTMMVISRCVYIFAFISIFLSLFLRKIGAYVFFFLFYLGLFWFGSNYMRLVYSCIVIPFLFFFVNINQKVTNQALKFSHAAYLIISESLLLFYLLRYTSMFYKN
jgi:hypothetical protein